MQDDLLHHTREVVLKWVYLVVMDSEHAPLGKHAIVDEDRLDRDGRVRRKGFLMPVDLRVRETPLVFRDAIDFGHAAEAVESNWIEKVNRSILVGVVRLVVVRSKEESDPKGLCPVE